MSQPRGVLRKGPAYVPLEVSTHAVEDDSDHDPVAYRYQPFSQRMANGRRIRSRPVRNWSRLIGGVAVTFVVAAVALWSWAVVLLLLRLNAWRQPHEPSQMHYVQENDEKAGPLPAAPVETRLRFSKS
eukprot:Skav233740  [mRNA]  locus=scaffold1625:33302:37269:- [translate_table: standard]